MDIQSKLGPLPVWAWGLIIGGLAVVWLWVSGRTDTTDYSQSVTGESGNPVPDDIAPGGDFSTVPVMPETGDTPTPSDTNDDWLRRAVDAVINSGVSTVSAQRAIQKYLSGETLTTAEEGIVNKALTETGLPPDGTATPSVEPSEPESDPGPVSNETTTALGGSRSARYGVPLAISGNVRWADPRKTGRPSGSVTFNVDGYTRTRKLVNGKAVAIYTPKRKGGAGKDGVYKVHVTYNPTGGAKPSASTPTVIRIK